jgi:TolB-like protein/Flp pilus assembly protein TadD
LTLFSELKRRKVFRVGAAYVVVAWLVLQVADVFLNNIEAPGWVFQVILLVLGIGFPLSLVFAWAFEMTPDGIRKDSEVEGVQTISHPSGRKLTFLILSVLAAGVIFFFLARDQVIDDSQASVSTLIQRPSVLVLPFTNASGDSSKEYMAFGLTDELIAGLQRYKDFPVIPRSTALEFRDTALSTDEFVKLLDASYTVEGSINSAGDKMRVLATMSDSTGKQVWADRFQRDAGAGDMFDLADELVSKVASAVLDSEIDRSQRSDHPPQDAWEHYVKGLEVVLAFDPADYESARTHLDQAVELAPELAEAWWALGELEVSNYVAKSRMKKTDLEDFDDIIEYFRKSHELSPFYAAACGCLGYMLAVVGQNDEARAVFSQAVEANPLSADLRIDYASFLLVEGKYGEALENANLAWKLGAGTYDRAGVWITRATVALAEDDKATALEAVNRSIFIDKNVFHTPVAVAILYVLGEEAGAARLHGEMEQAFPDLSPQNPVLYLMLKPIDDILRSRQERGDPGGPGGPENVQEIFDLLQNGQNPMEE